MDGQRLLSSNLGDCVCEGKRSVKRDGETGPKGGALGSRNSQQETCTGDEYALGSYCGISLALC
jgi:hypothetical protein